MAKRQVLGFEYLGLEDVFWLSNLLQRNALVPRLFGSPVQIMGGRPIWQDFDNPDKIIQAD